MSGMRDVANLAGVSLSTVSVVLSDSGKYVSPEVVKKVQEAAAALGYKVPFSKRFVQNAVAVLFPQITSSYFSNVLTGIDEVASESNSMILYYNSNLNFDREKKCVSILKKQKISGLVLDSACPQELEQQYLDYLREEFIARNVPVVFLGRRITDPDFYCVYVDNYKSSYEETEYLIGRGCKKIAYLIGKSKFSHAIERYQGYLDALRDHQIEIDESIIIQGDYSALSGYVAMASLLSRGDSFDALLSANDHMAIGAIKAIKAHGLRIPQDIAVVGFDNLSISSMIEPALTTMRPPALQMGRMAARLACSADRQSFARENKFDVKLVIRKSSDETCTSEWELTGW